MCGILIFPKNKVSLIKAKKYINHRGPDAFKYEEIDDIVLCHSLLQIRGNLEISLQPRYTRSERFLILFNGQIYNTDYLNTLINVQNKDLDTDYIVEIIEKYGIDGLKYIDGMYAIAIYDIKLKKLFITRDPSGQKNLYYSYFNNEIIICSEIYPIINILENKIRLSKLGVMEYLIIGFNSDSNTIYDNIYKLLPGQLIEYCLYKKEITNKFFLKKKFNSFNSIDIKELINDNIKKHLISKKKIAINLSGGIDSNLILHETLRLGYKIDVFSTFCETKDFNFNEDFKIAKEISNKNNLNFYETFVNKKIFLDNVIGVNEILEEPSRNSANTLYYLNFKSQKLENYKTIISGSGGDEIFIGYPGFFLNTRYQKLLNYIIKFFKHDFFLTTLAKSLSEFNDKYAIPKKFISPKLHKLKEIITLNYINNFLKYNQTYYPNKEYLSSNYLRLINSQYGWLANESFISFDKLSMNNSIEIRSPFASLDFRLKFMNFIKSQDFKSNYNKPLIRSTYQNLMDPMVLNKLKKTGWPIPKEWINSNEFKKILSELIPKYDDYIKWTEIKKMLNKNLNNYEVRYLYSIFSFLCIKKKLNLSF
jgi:asparagine synthase (glutamine-hydrolysing)